MWFLCLSHHKTRQAQLEFPIVCCLYVILLIPKALRAHSEGLTCTSHPVHCNAMQGMILDSKEFYAPIITPYEAQLAFLPEGADTDGSFRLDFDSLLEQQQKVWLNPSRHSENSWHAHCTTCSIRNCCSAHCRLQAFRCVLLSCLLSNRGLEHCRFIILRLKSMRRKHHPPCFAAGRMQQQLAAPAALTWPWPSMLRKTCMCRKVC